MTFSDAVLPDLSGLDRAPRENGACVYALCGPRKSIAYDFFCDWLGQAPDPRIFIPDDIQ